MSTLATPAPVPVTETPETDPFESTFAELSKLPHDAPAAVVNDVLKGEPAPTSAPAAIEEKPAEETPAAPAEEVPAATEEKPAEETPAAEPKPAPAPTPAAATPEPAPVPEPAPEPEAPLYTAEDEAFLADYRKEYEDIAKGEALARRADMKWLYDNIIGQVADAIKPMLAKMDTIDAVAGHVMHGELVKSIPNYDELRDGMLEWVKTEPNYLQDGYNRVINEGTLAEVRDLTQRYLKATGATLGAPTTTSTPATAKPDTELPASVKQAADLLAPVSSKRTVAIKTDEPEDFSGSFAKFAAQP